MIERLHVGPLSPGALHGDPATAARPGRSRRPTLLRLHEASGGNPFFALELARVLGRDVDPTQPLPVPETLERARTRSPRRAARTRRARALLLACTHGRLHARTARRRHTRAGVRGQRDRARRRGDPLHASAARLRALSGASPSARRRAHERLAEIVDDPLARARHRALAAAWRRMRSIAAALEEAARRRDRPRRADRRGGALRARPARDTRRARTRIVTGARLAAAQPTSLREREHDHGRSRSSSLADGPGGHGARRGARAPGRARGSATLDRAARGGARRGGRESLRLQASIHRRLAVSDASRKE